MSEFQNLENDAEKYAKDHPDQVHKAEQDAEHEAESRLGLGGDQGQGNQDQGNQQDQGSQGQGSQLDPDQGNAQQGQQ